MVPLLMTLKYISRSFSLGCHFHVHFSYPWHAFASHGLPAIAEVLVEHPIATPLSTTYWRSEAAKSARVRPGRRDIIAWSRSQSIFVICPSSHNVCDIVRHISAISSFMDRYELLPLSFLVDKLQDKQPQPITGFALLYRLIKCTVESD